MRSEEREAVGGGPAPGSRRRRLVDRLGPLGRRIRGRRAAPWRVAALAAATALAAAASLTLFSPEARRLDWLDGGRAFAPDEADAILNALTIKGIAGQVDDRGRIGVAPDRLAEALKILDELGLSRRALIREFDDPPRPSLMADSLERVEVLLRAEARKVERALEGIPGIVSAVVVLQAGPGRPFARPEVARAGILLRADRGRPVPQATVEKVLNVVRTFTELDQGDVTISDALGNALLKAGDPGFARSRRAEARVRAWEAAIAEELSRVVDGARVEVRLEEPIDPDPAPGPAVEAEAPPEPEPETVAAVVPNGPMSLERAPGPSPGAEAIGSRANVLVEVPASYYLARHNAFVGGREPRQEILDRFVAFTEEYIRKIVAHVIPEGSLGRLQVHMLPLPPDPPEPMAAALDSRYGPGPWWAPAAAVGVVAGVALAAAAGGWFPVRRPAGRSIAASAAPPAPHLPPLRDDDAPGPADRVRELVRSDPAAAAAVLRRWVGQGADV